MDIQKASQKVPQKAPILIVDDDPIALEMLKEMLEEHYRVTAVESGIEALKLLQKADANKYSAVILDRMMPKMSGLDVLHKTYQMPHLAHTPIIILTSHAEREDVGAAVIAGVFDFLYKPIDQELLLLVLKRALKENIPS